jgi:hypothetical protein
MTSSNFNLRGIAPQVMALLRQAAKEKQISINHLMLKLIEQGIGFTPKGKRTLHHDLDSLAGTWSAKENESFEKNTQFFERIDDELWK